jgi:hypothetical protein
MQKLVRNLSTRTKVRPAAPSHDAVDTGSTDIARKGSLTSPIPPNTVIHFPKCAHTTPPTPRPAQIPPVLRTEIIESKSPVEEVASAMQDMEITGSREDIVPAGLEDPTAADGASIAVRGSFQIRQYLSSPTRCLDCTLLLAREQEKYLRDQSAATLRELKLRTLELSSGIRAVYRTAAVKNGRPGCGDGKLHEEDIKALEKIESEETAIKEKMVAEKKRLRGELERVWDAVRKDWEGAIREVVRDDGTGEAEEICCFVVPEVAGALGTGEEVGVERGNGGEVEAEDELDQVAAEYKVHVMWLAMEGF